MTSDRTHTLLSSLFTGFQLNDARIWRHCATCCYTILVCDMWKNVLTVVEHLKASCHPWPLVDWERLASSGLRFWETPMCEPVVTILETTGQASLPGDGETGTFEGIAPVRCQCLGDGGVIMVSGPWSTVVTFSSNILTDRKLIRNIR